MACLMTTVGWLEPALDLTPMRNSFPGTGGPMGLGGASPAATVNVLQATRVEPASRLW